MHFHATFFALLTAAAVAGAGCKPVVNQDHDHDHGDESRILQISVWTNGYEVFAEHPPPVAGKRTTFTTHITTLQTLEPRGEGPVQFVMRKGDTVAEHPQAGPARPGIYLPGIRFPEAGNWQLTLLIPRDGTNAAIDLGTIQVHADDHAAAHAEFPEAPTGVSFLKEQQWRIRTQAEPAAKRRLVERVQVLARTKAKPGFSAAIAAPLAGQVALPEGRSLPLPGAHVKAGELLALIQPRFSDAAARFMEIEAEFARTDAVLKQTEATYERTKKLFDQEARSQRELQEAEVALATERGRHSAASALRSTYAGKPNGEPLSFTSGLELRAPISGMVTSVSAGVGEPVTSDQIIFTLLDPRSLWIEASVPEALISRIQNTGNALCELLDGTEQLLSFAAEGGGLVFAGLEVDATTRTVPLIYEFNNANAQLRVGQAVRLHVETAYADETLAIPHSALVEEGGVYVAYVQTAGESFEKRTLRLGIRDGRWIEVLDGIAEGERVVTQGAYAIRLASASALIPAHGHVH